MTDVRDTLNERRRTHGSFSDMSGIAQDVKDLLHQSCGWWDCTPPQRQALELIADKMARIVCGDPNFVDHWHDIIGYAQLVKDHLTIDTGCTEKEDTELQSFSSEDYKTYLLRQSAKGEGKNENI